MNFLNLSTHKDHIEEITKKNHVLINKRNKLLFSLDNSRPNLEKNETTITHQHKRFVQPDKSRQQTKPSQPKQFTSIKLENKTSNTLQSYQRVKQYPVLFHKYMLNLRNPEQEIYYKIYFEKKDAHFKENLFMCHIHLTSLNNIKEYLSFILQDVVKERILIVTFEEETYSIEQLKKLNIPNFICLKTLPVGKYIGGRIVTFQYLQDIKKHYENIIFLHDKIEKNKIKKYYNTFLNKISLQRIKKLLQHVDFIYPNNGFNGDWNLNEGYFLTNKYVNDMNNFLGFENKTSLFISDGIFIANKNVIETIYNSSNLKILYNILNSKTSFDVNWVKMYYKLKSTNIQEIYRTYQTNNLLGSYYNNENLLEIKNKDILFNNQKIEDGYILKDGTLEDIFDKLWINAILNSKLKYINFHDNFFGNKERTLCINYHCFDRYFFNISSFGYLIEILYLLDYYVDIHITFIDSKSIDNEIIKILKERYNKYNTRFYIHHRKNGGADLKTIFTTMEYCNKNNLNYKWFYHIHTKKIQNVAKDNIVFYNDINCILNMINTFTLNPNFSIFGSGLQTTMNALEYTRGVVYNFKNFLDTVEYENKITLAQIFNSIFFGGNIYICNFKYLKQIISKMNLKKLYGLMGDPNFSYDKYWINIMCSNFFVNDRIDNIEKMFNKGYITTGNCYSPHSLAIGLRRDFTVMHILERTIPLLLQLNGPIYCFGKKTNKFSKKIYRNRNKDLIYLNDKELYYHFLHNSFVEGRIAEPNIYDGIYEVNINFPLDKYYKSVVPFFNKPIHKIKQDFNEFKILNHSFYGICGNGSKSLINMISPYININSIDTIYKPVNKSSEVNFDDLSVVSNDILYKKNLQNHLYHFPNISFIKVISEYERNINKDPFLNVNVRFLEFIESDKLSNKEKYLVLTHKNSGDILHDLLFSYNNEKKINLIVNQNTLEKCFHLIYNIRYLIIIIENGFVNNFTYKNNIIEDKVKKNSFKFMRDNNSKLKRIYYKFISYMLDYDSYKNLHNDLATFNDEELFYHINFNGFNERRCVTLQSQLNNISNKIPENIFENNKKIEDFCLSLLGVQTNINFDMYSHIEDINEKLKVAFDENSDKINKLPCKNLLKLNHFIFNKENYSYLNISFTNKTKYEKIKQLLESFNN